MLISRGLRIRKEKELKLERNVEVAKGRVGSVVFEETKIGMESYSWKEIGKGFWCEIFRRGFM
jgi:hypothetical protein